jgi:protocatechuate 3,4-dioxygenase alpha subunit
MMDFRTPSQTVGPFFSIGLSWPGGAHVVPEGTPGGIWIRGAVLDGAGEPVPDALLESWQANQDGAFVAHAEAGRFGRFRGLGRCPTSPDGTFGFFTIKPGRVPDARGALQAPHIAVAIFARGLIEHLVTRIYFVDEDNDMDPVFRSLEHDPRRRTLLATVEPGGYHFDVRLQGPNETIFFAL